LIVVHPGANWEHKRWLPERFAHVADRLAFDGRYAVALSGAPEDVPLVERMRRQMVSDPLVLAGHTSLRQLAACLARARLVIANDTGVMHIAAALERPVVALFGPTSPALTGPVGDPERTLVIHHPDCCPHVPCAAPHHPASPGMASIHVEEVLDAAQKLLRGVR